jgi:RNA polymerase sigma factor (sigma-70 family)
VCTSAYAHFEYERLFISEGSPPGQYGSRPDSTEWSDDEIAAIRVVLHKLTSLRIADSMDAEDLVQDTLLTMIAKSPGDGLEKGLLVWSMGVLRKKVGNYYRKAQRCAWIKEREACVRRRIRQSMLAASPERRVAYQELWAVVEKTLIQLPPPQRNAMELLIAGFEAGEIAKQLHPERYQNVINHLYRGRKRLAKELARHGYGPNAKVRLLRRGCIRKT